jgi:hypothetical protein
MATAYPPVAAQQITMPKPIVIEPRRSIRKSAPDQKFSKARKLTKTEAKRIGKEGSAKLLAETGSKELAKDFESAMLRILSDSAA